MLRGLDPPLAAGRLRELDQSVMILEAGNLLLSLALGRQHCLTHPLHQLIPFASMGVKYWGKGGLALGKTMLLHLVLQIILPFSALHAK